MDLKGKKILIIDHSLWREGAAKTLQDAGVEVTALPTYAPGLVGENIRFDLVLVVCYRIDLTEDDDEAQLINDLLEQKFSVVLLLPVVPSISMRELFRRGILDVTDKAYSPMRLLELVEEAFSLLNTPKDSYSLFSS